MTYHLTWLCIRAKANSCFISDLHLAGPAKITDFVNEDFPLKLCFISSEMWKLPCSAAVFANCAEHSKTLLYNTDFFYRINICILLTEVNICINMTYAPNIFNNFSQVFKKKSFLQSFQPVAIFYSLENYFRIFHNHYINLCYFPLCLWLFLSCTNIKKKKKNDYMYYIFTTTNFCPVTPSELGITTNITFIEYLWLFQDF